MEKCEIIVNKYQFGYLVEEFVKSKQRLEHIDSNWVDTLLRMWLPMLDISDQRRVISAIEVGIAIKLPNNGMWSKIVKDLRPPRSPFTIKYVCSTCGKDNVKLWRDYNTFAEHIKLECAECLCYNVKVDENGRAESENFPGVLSDQLNGKVPAVPVDDTFWGYTSVPSQDIEWWRALPTYK